MASTDKKAVTVKVSPAPSPKKSKPRYYKPKVNLTSDKASKSLKKKQYIVSQKTVLSSTNAASKKVAADQNIIYDGAPIGTISRVVTPADIVLYCQFVALKNFMDRPALFTYPATTGSQSPTFEPFTPSELVAYYVAACVQMYYREAQVDNTSSIDLANKFPETYVIPVELAHWIKYQIKYGDKDSLYHAETRLQLAQDFLLPTKEVLPTTSATINPYNLSAFCVTNVQGLDNVGIFPLTQGNASAGDVTLYLGNQSYTGLYAGSQPFIQSGRVVGINTMIKRNFGFVPLEKVTSYAPDLSAYGVGVSITGSATTTGWSGFRAIMNNSSDYDPQMVPILRPNLGSVQGDLEVAGSFLGAMKCVPMGTQLICSTAQGIPVVTSTPMEFQYIQQFIWIAQRNKYFHGRCFGKAGFKLNYDGKQITVPNLCNWVARTIDYNLIMRRIFQGLADYLALNVQTTPPTSDFLCNFVCCLDSMIGDRAQTLGNCLWATGSSPSSSFVPQSFVPNRCSDLPLPLFIKAILDQIGPAYAAGYFYYPTMYLNCGATQLTNNTGQYWSKFGLIPNASGNRFRGTATNTNFENDPFFLPITTFFANSASTFTPYAGEGGLTTGLPGTIPYGEVYIGQMAASNATAFMTNQLALPTLNGYSPNFVYWFNGVATMWDGVLGYLRLRSINAKLVAGTQHIGWGGPGMLATVVFASQASGSTSQGGCTFAVIDTSPGVGSAILINTNVVIIYEMWAPRRVTFAVPTSRRDIAVVQAYGPCSYYVLSGSLAPADVRTPTFAAGLSAVSGAQVYKAFISELVGTETALIAEYMKNRSSQHAVMSSSTGLHVGSGKVDDCLMLPFTKAADSISSAMESVDEWTSIIPVPGVARSIFKFSSKVLHHYAVYGSKVNSYFKEKRRRAKEKESSKAMVVTVK